MKDFRTHLSLWISKFGEWRTVFDLSFKSHYDSSWDMRTQLLDLARALEAYHRTAVGGQYLSTEEYEPVAEALIKAIPQKLCKSHRDALKGRIKYGYQYSLRKRLVLICQDILSNQKNVLEKLVGDSELFAGKVVNARNELTHPEESSNRLKVTPDELRYLIPRIQLLLRIIFLVEMNFPPDQITQLLHDNLEYKRLTKNQHS